MTNLQEGNNRGRLISSKLHFWQSVIDEFAENLSNYSKEQKMRLHHDIKNIVLGTK